MAGVDIEQRKREFSQIFDEKSEIFIEKVNDAFESKRCRVLMNINELREKVPAAELIEHPREYLHALRGAINDFVKSNEVDLRVSKKMRCELQVGFEGSLGANSVTPRGLISRLINNLVEVEGIVTKCSSVRPKLVQTVEYCEETQKYSTTDYRDATSNEVGLKDESKTYMQTSSGFKKQDEQGNKVDIEWGLCKYKNYQTIVLQEMPEKAKVGQLPRSIEVVLENDLVDRAKPGDRVMCVGVFQSLPGMQQNTQTSGVFPTKLICNNISIVGKEVGAVMLTPTDVKNIRELSGEKNILDTMARSLCPSIYGHNLIKRALILQLLGGNERNLENKTHLRGDINIMLVGDPSTAKSQLLRAMMDIAPLAISTTGRGSSGVGLTAAVTSDIETGEKRLEAGAMVLADRGIVCVDEFDKMAENDRVAIHEVMEQQTVTVAKAGIHASLNARCSVLAAANPVYGQYNTNESCQRNIGLPDSLLSRFDLLFIVIDQFDPKLDRTLSNHVIKSHQYRKPGTIMEPEPLHQNSTLNLDDDDVVVNTQVYQRGNNDLLTKEFLRKYIHYAKKECRPELSQEAMESIPVYYTNMRSRTTNRNLPITARTLETIIRLSTGSAKARLSHSVDTCDVEIAMELVNFVLFHDIRSGSEPEHSTFASSSAHDVAGNGNQAELDGTQDVQEDDEDDNIDVEDILDNYDSSNPRYQRVMKAMEGEDEEITLVALTDRLNDSVHIGKGQRRFRRREIEAILRSLERENKIMYDEAGIITII